MIHPSHMKDPAEIEQHAIEEAKKLNIRGDNINYFVIGHFAGVTRSLQEEIRKIHEKIKYEHEWVESDIEEKENEWAQGYKAAVESIAIASGVEL